MADVDDDIKGSSDLDRGPKDHWYQHTDAAVLSCFLREINPDGIPGIDLRFRTEEGTWGSTLALCDLLYTSGVTKTNTSVGSSYGMKRIYLLTVLLHRGAGFGDWVHEREMDNAIIAFRAVVAAKFRLEDVFEDRNVTTIKKVKVGEEWVYHENGV